MTAGAERAVPAQRTVPAQRAVPAGSIEGVRA